MLCFLLKAKFLKKSLIFSVFSEKIVSLIYLSELEKLHVSYTEETFKKCNKEGLVKGLWRNHSHEAQVNISLSLIDIHITLYERNL